MPKSVKAAKSQKAKNAQPAYVLKVAAPKRSARASLPSSDTIAQLQALAQSGLLNSLLPKGVVAAPKAEGGGFDIQTLLRLYAQYRPLIDMLLPLIQGLFKRDAKPAPAPDPAPGPVPLPDQGEIDGPDEPSGREVGRLEAKLFWVARKKTPHKAGGGRYLLSDEGKQRILSGADPLQAGDRCCFDVSPYDKKGVRFETPAKPLVLEHVVGGVGELQQQEENDYTPVVLTPWLGEAGQPGFSGEITYQARGGGFETKVIRLRVRPWA